MIKLFWMSNFIILYRNAVSSGGRMIFMDSAITFETFRGSSKIENAKVLFLKYALA